MRLAHRAPPPHTHLLIEVSDKEEVAPYVMLLTGVVIEIILGTKVVVSRACEPTHKTFWERRRDACV